LNQKADVTAEYSEQSDATILALNAQGRSFTVQLNATGQHNAYNALAAVGVATALNIKPEAIAKGLASFQGVGGRLQSLLGVNGATVIDDTYNANPDSMRAAIDVLSKKSGHTIFVMGDMAELGEEAPALHAEVGAYADQKGIDTFFALGVMSADAAEAFGERAQAFDVLENLVAALSPMLNADVTVLVKGSRSMRMERVVKEIQAKEEEAPCC